MLSLVCYIQFIIIPNTDEWMQKLHFILVACWSPASIA